jgi:outer membrane protein
MNKRRQPRLGMVLAMLFAAFFAQAQTETKHAFSVQQAVEYAKKNNVQVKNALLAIQVQEQVNRGITAAAYPNLAGSGTVTDYIVVPTQVIPGDNFGGPPGSLLPVQFGLKYSSSALLQLQQLLFDGQVFVGLQARKTSIDFVKKNVDVTEEAIKVNIYKIYYQLAVSKTQIDLLDSNIVRLEKLRNDANEYFKNGFAEKLDVDKLDVQLTNLKTERIKYLNSIEIGYYGLKTLMGMPVKDTLILTDKVTDNDIKANALIDSVNYTDRQDFQYLGLMKKLNEYNIKRYKLSYLPSLGLTGVYGKQAYRQRFDFFGKGDWYDISYVGLNLSVPIFSGFAKDAKVKQSKIELQQTQNNIDNLKLSIDNEVESARLKYASAIQALENQKRNMELAKRVTDQTEKKFFAGIGSNTEINTARIEQKTAETAYTTALYDAIIAKVDFLKAIGKL